FSAAEERVKPEGERAKPRQPFFGLTIVTCERGVLRQSPDGVYVYSEDGREEIPCPPRSGHNPELMELVAALAENRPAFPDGRWGKATLEVCLAILASSKDGTLHRLQHQIAVPQGLRAARQPAGAVS